MDLIAKAQFLHMVQHNGYFGCKDCLIEGEHVKNKKGYSHCYPYEQSMAARKREKNSFYSDALEAHTTRKTVSQLVIC